MDRDCHPVTQGRLQLHDICALHIIADLCLPHEGIAVPQTHRVILHKLGRNTDALLRLPLCGERQLNGVIEESYSGQSVIKTYWAHLGRTYVLRHLLSLATSIY